MLPDESQRDGIFWDLWESHKKLFFGKCLTLMNGNVYEAEEMFSTAMLKAREKMIENRCGIDNFRGWALRLTENVCLDQLRKNRRFICCNEFPDSLVHDEINDSHVVMESNENYHSRESLLWGLFKFVGKLPIRLREPVLLRFLFCRSYREIAGRLNITEATARKRVQQARQAMKLKYGDKINALFSSCEEERIMPDSPVMKKIRQRIVPILDTVESEFNFRHKTAWVINVSPITGADREALVFLPIKPNWHKKGFASFLKYISQHPEGCKRQMELGQMLYVSGLWDQAEKIFCRVMKKRPRFFLAPMLLGEMLMESERTDEAYDIFQEAGSQAYRDSSRLFMSGMAAMSRTRAQDAIDCFEKAAGLEPENLTFSHAKGICLFRTEQYSRALEFFRNILAGSPQDIVSLVYCCESSILLNQPAQALEYLDRILMNNPLDIYALKRKSKLAELRCIPQRKDTRRLQRLAMRHEELYRIMKEPENDKFTDGVSNRL